MVSIISNKRTTRLSKKEVSRVAPHAKGRQMRITVAETIDAKLTNLDGLIPSGLIVSRLLKMEPPRNPTATSFANNPSYPGHFS